MLPDPENLRRHLQERLSPRRYRHSLEVQKTAIRLAGIHGADWYKAGIAGLLHDVCHDMQPGDLLNYLRSCGILPDILTLENPPLYHAIAGREYARDVLRIGDSEVLNAIRYHTTGRAGMTVLEKVVYVADLVSDDRDFDDAPLLREMAQRSLEDVLRHSLRRTLTDVLARGLPLTQDAWEAYNHYILQEKEPFDDIQ